MAAHLPEIGVPVTTQACLLHRLLAMTAATLVELATNCASSSTTCGDSQHQSIVYRSQRQRC